MFTGPLSAIRSCHIKGDVGNTLFSYYISLNGSLFIFLCYQIAKLQSVDLGGSDLRWVEQFNVGSTVKGKVHEIKEFGVVVSFQKYDDIFGFISHYQCKSL